MLSQNARWTWPSPTLAKGLVEWLLSVLRRAFTCPLWAACHHDEMTADSGRDRIQVRWKNHRTTGFMEQWSSAGSSVGNQPLALLLRGQHWNWYCWITSYGLMIAQESTSARSWITSNKGKFFHGINPQKDLEK